MKKIARLLTAICLLPFLMNAQDPVWVSSPEIKEVRIYQSGAMVTRTAKATLNPGLQEIVFDGLSPYINPQSILMKGTGDATILSVTFQTDYLKERKKSKELLKLESDLDSVGMKLQQSRNRIAVLNETQNLLLANKSIGGANNGVLADELEPMVEYFIKKLAELKQEHLEETNKERKINEQLIRLQQQLQVIKSKSDQPTGNIIVRLNAGTRGMAGFEFSYVINNAVSWYAFYDLKAKDTKSPFELVYKAKVNQNSGEDWNQVRISLSTGNPSIGNEKPTLYPWMLNFYQPVVYQKGATRGQDMPMAAPVMQEMVIAAGAKEQEDMKAIPVVMNQNALNATFEILTPYTIPSDGQEYQVEIQKYEMKAEYNYVAIPKLDADAFLTAKITGWEDLSLSPGGANIYFDGAYVGESFINPAATNDTLEISLGRDKRIVVKRETLKDLSGNKLFGGNKERSLSYDITVKNGKKEAISLLLLDQVPVSMQKDIEVKTEELSGAEYNTETGEIKWKLQLPAGETMKKRLSFKVKYPKDKQIMGL
jgi:uncharacterized protein (TIGR02231 family)